MNSKKTKWTKTWFMARRFLADILSPLRYEVQKKSRMKKEKLEEYYLSFREKDMQQQKGGEKSFEFDKNGIPVVPSYIDVASNSFHYYPITIGQYALSVFHTYLESASDADKNRFLFLAEWFVKHATIDERRGAYWLTHTEKPEYHVKKAWVSAFSQSRGISVLLRAYQLTGKKGYFELAKDAIKIYDIESSEGGVKSFFGEAILYEEYTAPFPIGVLDGAFFSLFGLFDLKRVAPNTKNLEKLIKQGILGLEVLLPKFDMGYWIKYSLVNQLFYPQNEPATKSYFYLVLCQLYILYLFTERPVFLYYYNKFSAYDTWKNMVKMYYKKFQGLKKLNRL